MASLARFVGSTADSGPQVDVARDDLFTLLSNERRQHVVRTLEGREESITVRKLSRAVAARENGKAGEDVTRDERKRVYVSLVQNHLDKFDDAGLIEYDVGGKVVETNLAMSYAAAYLRYEPDLSSESSVPESEDELLATYCSGVALVGGILAMGAVGNTVATTTRFTWMLAVLFLTVATGAALISYPSLGEELDDLF